jgi:hypothetical protein
MASRRPAALVSMVTDRSKGAVFIGCSFADAGRRPRNRETRSRSGHDLMPARDGIWLRAAEMRSGASRGEKAVAS